MEGTVVWFSEEKKMGLIKDSFGKLHVVHRDQFKKKDFERIQVGKTVRFVLGDFPGFVESIKEVK